MRLLPLLALLMAAAHSQEQPGVADHTHLNPSSPSWREHSLAPPYLNAGMAMVRAQPLDSLEITPSLS